MANRTTDDQQDEITLREMAVLLWSRRWFITSITILSAALAVGGSFLFEKTYRATVVVSAVTTSAAGGQMGGASSLLSQFGGLASLAGISLGNDNKKAESLAVLQSEALTEDFLTKNDLLPILYSGQWDPTRKAWKTNDPKKVPTLWKANLYFKTKIRDVETDSKSGLVTVSVTWKDPKLAAQWANALVRLANDYLRNRAIQEAERNIAYLNEQASKTDVTGVRQSIFSILQNEIYEAMIARGNLDYALKVIDPAFSPEIAFSPKRVVWLVAGFIGGLLLSITLAFLSDIWRADASAQS